MTGSTPSTDGTATAPSRSSRPPRRRRRARADRPALAPGARLLGDFEAAGFEEPQHLARAADGTMVQLTELLYLIALHADGRTPVSEIAARVSEKYGKQVPPEVVDELIDEQLVPPGVVVRGDGAGGATTSVDPLLALRLRTRVVEPDRVTALARPFRVLFWPPVVALFVAAFVAVDIWLFFVHGIGASLQQTLSMPGVFLLVFGLTFASAGFHEVGHAAACLYGGARPGEMGAGVYLAWPAFYTDVTDAYRLGRTGRLRTDLGGIYFNAVFSVALTGVYAATRFEPLLLVVLAQQFQILQQLLPIVRLDGYYIVSDLVGVPDLFARLKSIVVSVLPGRRPDQKARALKPWARRVVAGWVVVTVSLLTFALGRVLVGLPDLYATSFATIGGHLRGARVGLAERSLVDVVAATLQALTVLVAPVGLTYVLVRAGRSVLTRCYRRVRPARAAAPAAATTSPASPSASRAKGTRSGSPAFGASAAAARAAPAAPAAAPAGSSPGRLRRTPRRVMRRTPRVPLTTAERRLLVQSIRDPRVPRSKRTRARIVLAAALGLTDAEAARRIRVSPGTVARWRARVERDGLRALELGPARRRRGRPERRPVSARPRPASSRGT